ncbi:PP2C family protein-serine/threonine phosphatase [Kitasatospora sp. NPDC056327]|uniref:PP2C family protein-serine/threonine phosphatase n=1 Tax=Kitasatospora sp. NPDC056327 TaxID=3345785 RepID=UPI0035D8865E
MTDHDEPTAQVPGGSPGAGPHPAAIREILAALPGSVVFLRPERGPDGGVVDFRLVAASPGALDIGGRDGERLLGLGVLDTYPGIESTDLWRDYLRVLRDGSVHEGVVEYEEKAAGIPHRSRYRVRVAPCQGGLIVSWNRLDAEEREQRRLALMQRLGRMGWVDRDLVGGVITWSDEVYSIFERDRSLGPLTLEELSAHAVAGDRPAVEDAVRRLLKIGEPVDHTFRVRLPGREVRHVRVVAESETDVEGRPVRLHGFFQDLTAAKEAEQQLMEQRQAAVAHGSLLAAERDLAARLQDTLLPAPQQTLDLAGLTVDVAYLPLQEGLSLGGDWYSAIELPDGTVLLVVGDVAGHGLDAVATMALLRFTAKGMAITGTALPAVLANLNTLLLHTPERAGQTATMVMAAYRPATSRLTWVRAGHPPPLLVRDGRARFLPSTGGILLGAVPTARYEASTVDLLPGDHLYLYTDGLVERPGEPIDEGLARLAGTALAHVDVARPLDGIVRDLITPHTRRDDICALHISR